ncbi:MAG: 50S ribosomal protein L10 [Deltaproteobacteria bacterium]|nr:50S ribosomal protein L10 [Deltaproteobacteria bacterium]MBW1950194.1 50S ribosomal protein L10 [Deltaproteobacteria bacterium]MBW2008155.1 50S ribosomal protein L10 [Deltaproteobacteria bacterium]
MKRTEKEKLVVELRERLERAQATFLVDFQGMDVESMNRLRGELRRSETDFQVVKNRLLKRACAGTDTENLAEYMTGPSALAMTYGDVVALAKALVDFAKEVDKLKIKCGQLSGKIMDAAAVKRLAELPGREALLSQVLGTMQGVPAAFVRVLSGCIGQLLNVLKAVEEQKGQ